MIPEIDVQMLDAYLDGVLSPVEVQHMEQRLADEPKLSAGLGRMRAERAIRLQAWRTFEQDDSDRFASQVNLAVRRIDRWRALRKFAWRASAAAACVGFFYAGWFFRGNTPAGSVSRGTGPIASHTDHATPATEAASPFQVALTDQNGNVIAIQKFTKLEEAKQFADDLMRYEERRTEVRDGSPMLVSDHF